MKKQIVLLLDKDCLGFFIFMIVASANVIFLTMKNSTTEIQKLQVEAEVSINKTAELQQALAQIEAALSRKENQKILEKAHKI